MNQENTANNVARPTKAEKFRKGVGNGWRKFIKRDRLTNANNGFMKDDTIIIDASLDIYLKEFSTITT